MSISSQVAARCCRQIVRPSAASLRLSSSTYLSQRTRRWQSTEVEAAAPVNPKISQIVDQISTLTLLETADLVATLKVRSLFVSFRISQTDVVQCFCSRAPPPGGLNALIGSIDENIIY